MKGGEMSLSFLDMLSCSLGAMILLFLVFATMEHQGLKIPERNQVPVMSDVPVPIETVALGDRKPMPNLFEVLLEYDTEPPTNPKFQLEARLADAAMPETDARVRPLHARGRRHAVVVENPADLHERMTIRINVAGGGAIAPGLRVSVRALVAPLGAKEPSKSFGIINANQDILRFDAGAGLHFGD